MLAFKASEADALTIFVYVLRLIPKNLSCQISQHFWEISRDLEVLGVFNSLWHVCKSSISASADQFSLTPTGRPTSVLLNRAATRTA
jgi:hypothetical protein